MLALRSTSVGHSLRLSKGSLSTSGQVGVRPEGLGLQTPVLMLRSAPEQAANWTHTDGLCRMDHCLEESGLWFQNFPVCEGQPGGAVCVCVVWVCAVCMCICVCEWCVCVCMVWVCAVSVCICGCAVVFLYAVCVVCCMYMSVVCMFVVCMYTYMWGGFNQAPYDLHGSMSLLPSWAPFSIKEKNYTFYFMTALCVCVRVCVCVCTNSLQLCLTLQHHGL